MRRHRPPHYTHPWRGYSSGGRSPPSSGGGGYGTLKDQSHGSSLVRNIPLSCRTSQHCLRLLSHCKSLKRLLQIHGGIIVSGMGNDNFTLTHLINSYTLMGKCDLARLVFSSARNPGLVLWDSMIRAHIRAGCHKEAVKMYHCMLRERLEPSKYTYTFVLKACTGCLDLEEGERVHTEVAEKGLECDVYIGTALVDMYCKIGSLWNAWDVFNKMRIKDLATWNAIIAGFSQSSNPHVALELFQSMQAGGFQPNFVSMLNLFPAICKLMDIKSCRSFHGYVTRRDFPVAVFNGMIDMYSKCGITHVARRIFDLMLNRDGISWGTMMAGYVQDGFFSEVIELFEQIKNEKLRMNNVSVVSALLAASEMRDLEKGREVHDCAIRQGIDSDVVVATSILTMYAKCGQTQKAKQLFDVLQGKDVVAWSALMAAFVKSGSFDEVLSLFRDMQNGNLKPDTVTLLSAIPACAELCNLKIGKSLHCYAIKNSIDSDVSIRTSLVSLYAKCENFTSALAVFNGMTSTDLSTWNALVNSYAQIGDGFRAIHIFLKLKQSQVQPDMVTMLGVLSAGALLHDIELACCIHGQIIRSGLESDCIVQNGVIDMYAKSGSLSLAEYLFNKTEFIKDEASWNILIAGYMHNDKAQEALATFRHMKLENFQPNLVTLVSVLPAAAYLAALREGMCIHACITRMGFQSYRLIGNSLIDMYAKCGRLDISEKFFNEMKLKNTVSWNALLAGYAVHGYADRAVELFSLMQENHVKVDSRSFVSILSACRHAGLVEEGKKFFCLMHEDYQLEPSMEHYASMVDLFGRAGLFDEAVDFIEKMPVEPGGGVWGALLSACRMHSNVKLGEVAQYHLTKHEPGNPVHHVVLSSMYAETCRWDAAGITRSKIRIEGLRKSSGYSWIETEKQGAIFSGV